MKQFEFACGGISLGAVDPDTQRIALDVQGDRSVNLRISDISRSMAGNIPALLVDLLEVAAYVYCADQRASRGSGKLTHAGSDWRRSMRFIIPVRRPDIWTSPSVADALHDTLSFLSDDSYEFEFVSSTTPMAARQAYFDGLSDSTHDADEVALFSGGIDSFAGVTETMMNQGKSMVLVGHHSASKAFAVQKELVSRLKQAGFANRLFYVPVNVTNTKVNPIEHTQRTRSFLFASLAFVLAQMFKRDSFTFFENGVVSLNLPIAHDVLGARATRTTHPKVIRGFVELFSALAEAPFEIRTPFIWSTKKDVVVRILQNGFGHLLSRTVSCAHPRIWTTKVHHCGACSQCIDRRFAVLAAGAEIHDAAGNYSIDLLTGDRSLDEDVRMSVAYVKFCQSTARCEKDQFIVQNPQVAAALSYVPELSPDEVLSRIWTLHRRHADDVLAVIEAGAQQYSKELSRGELPNGSLLSLCFGRSRIEDIQPSPYDRQVAEFMDRLDSPVCEFAVDTHGEKIFFRGGFCLEGANFKLVAALLENHRTAKAQMIAVPYIEPWLLAEKLGIAEQSMRQQLTRLRNLVGDRLAVDQGVVLADGFVENIRNDGYRLSPEIREISRADLQTGRTMSQTATSNVTQKISSR